MLQTKIEELSEKALKEFGKISTWVNNAGGLQMELRVILLRLL